MGVLKEYIKISLRSLRRRPVRSWLTMVGVVIGVFLIISLLSLSEGIKGAVMQQLKMMGNDLIMIMPGEVTDMVAMMAGGMELSEEDIKAIKKAEGVDIVVTLNYKAEAVRYDGEVKTLLVNGISLEEGLELLKSDMGWDIKEGRWPIPGKREIIVGSAVTEDVFIEMRVDTEIFIRGKKFQVVGVLESLGNKQDDSMITMDLDLFAEITGERSGAKMAMAKIESGYLVDDVVENIKEELNDSRKRVRGEDLPPFSVLSSEKVAGIAGDIMALIQAAIFGFASISIVVGGIGIMNTMYTSVHERIREIGIMKAVGAKRKTITIIFLIESGFFGLFGGLGGIILGLGLAKAIELYLQFHPVFYLEASITPQLILFGLTFSFLIGCLAGYFPARSASKLKPVDALRYE
ncbi:ABC transporter permease [Patescibacteria group bacterium]|nr:ABC transporter permease [Patescibacteria group bacterium]